MTKIRFEVPITPKQHAQLEKFAESVGVSPRDIARIAIARMLNDRESLLRPAHAETAAK